MVCQWVRLEVDFWHCRYNVTQSSLEKNKTRGVCRNWDSTLDIYVLTKLYGNHHYISRNIRGEKLISRAAELPASKRTRDWTGPRCRKSRFLQSFQRPERD